MSRIAAITFSTDYSIQPVPLARALEERGFEGLFLAEHTHIPANRESESYARRGAAQGVLAHP